MPELAGDEQSAEAAQPGSDRTAPAHATASVTIATGLGRGTRVPPARTMDEEARPERTGTGFWSAAFRSALAAWFAAHLLVIAIQDAAQRRTPPYPASMPGRPGIHHLFNQLYTWDTAWYAGIAQHGYSGVASDGVRFWPLLPLATRAVSAVGIDPNTAILVVCWSGALVFGMLMYRLAFMVGGDAVAARRAAWISQLAPGAFVLVMGYTEALSGLFAAAFLISVRRSAGPGRRTWLWHAAGFLSGLGSGLVRPTGLLLAAPGAIEAVRQRRDPWPHLAARVLTTLSPLLGTGLFLLWSHTVYGTYTLPYSIQKLVGLRGTYAGNPIQSALDSLNQVGNGAGALTVVLVVASLGLMWACVRRLPFSYTAYAALSLLAAITAPHFSSFARYAAGILPLLLVTALLTRDWRRWGWVVGSSAALCAYFAFQSFIGIYVP